MSHLLKRRIEGTGAAATKKKGVGLFSKMPEERARNNGWKLTKEKSNLGETS